MKLIPWCWLQTVNKLCDMTALLECLSVILEYIDLS